VTQPDGGAPSVLHVVVGHGLPTYFLNAVRSVRAAAPGDDLLVIDNASPSGKLRAELQRLADEDEKIKVVLRTTNDVLRNRKVGSLYTAYGIAFADGIGRGFDYLHLIQGDFQLLWWDTDLVNRAAEIFYTHPNCVNIETQMLSRDKVLAHEVVPAGADGLLKLSNYGLTDTGLYHLHRWRSMSMEFGHAEKGHAARYLADGFEVLCHPWPADAPIPWPAVMRGGKRRGREVQTSRPYLLRPLSPQDVVALKSASSHPWLEDYCVPWGWVCASPMWVTRLDSIDYWVLRYRDAKANGLGHILPRPDLRGVDRNDRRRPTGMYRYRPSLFRLFVTVPVSGLLRRLRGSRGAQCT
jgi:hypothetical protein